MHSSTSNSSQRCPAGRWRRIWLTGLGVAVCVLALFELAFRQAGFEPSVIDSMELWAYQRHRVDATSKRPVVLLGRSRMQLGFVPAELESRLPDHEAIQLALSGSHPLAVLEDLANDEQFAGTVLCSVTPESFLAEHWNDQKPYVDYFHREYARLRGLSRKLSNRVSNWLHDKILIIHPEMRVDSLVANVLLRGRSLEERLYIRMHPDRSRSADYGKVDIARYAADRLEYARSDYEAARGVIDVEWDQQMRRVGAQVRKLKARGGKVVFLRFITTGEHRRLDEAMLPRERYWDRLADATGAETLHFADVPGLGDFRCPDGSHLDRRDAGRYTGILVEALRARGVF